MMMLFRTISISALLLYPAYAQQTPAAPMSDSMSVMVPLPLNGCVWAGRPFSDGAGFMCSRQDPADLRGREVVS